MKKTLTAAVASSKDLAAPGVLWALLGGELAMASLFALSGRLPLGLVRSLQIFLRF